MGTLPVVQFDVELLATDMAARGWIAADLARAAGVNDMRVSRFLRGESQTPRTLAMLAGALGQAPDRYIVRRGSKRSAA